MTAPYPWPDTRLILWHVQGKTPYEMAQLLSEEDWQNELWIPHLGKRYIPSAPAVRNRLIVLGCKLHKGRRFGADTRKWKGGRKKGKGGYVLVLSKDHPNADSQGYVPEHRLVAEQVLGRYLTKEEIVHHIDGNPTNNQPSNLEVFDSNGNHVSTTITRHERSEAAKSGWRHSREKYQAAKRIQAATMLRDSEGKFVRTTVQERDVRQKRKTPIRLKEQLSK